MPLSPSVNPAPGQAPAQPSTDNPPQVRFRLWLHLLAWLLTLGTAVLLYMGGHVTTIGAGLAVYDWPTTLGHNMFDVPFKLWIDNPPVFAEHSHRLMGTAVGFISIALCLAVVGLRLFRRERRWLAWYSFILLLMVIAQGILGGLRVDERSQTLAFIHGIFGQVFFCCTIVMLAATGKTWNRLAPRIRDVTTRAGGLRIASIVVLGAVLIQIALGSAVRHTESALAIPDFPANYGHLIPPTTTAQLNRDAAAMTGSPTTHAQASHYTLTQVWLNASHRAWAIVLTVLALLVMVWAVKASGGRRELLLPVFLLAGLIAIQIFLGAAVVWSGRYATFATAHQTNGAFVFGATMWLAIRIHLVTLTHPHPQPQTAKASNDTSGQMSPAQGSLV